MAKELFNRYVWLIDTLQRYGRLTRREIDGLWQRSEYCLLYTSPSPRDTR